MLWILSSSLKTPQAFAGENTFAPPNEITFENYTRAFEIGDIPRNILNSAIVTVGANLLLILFGMMAAYAIHVIGFRWAKIARAVFLLGIIVPVQIALVPLFIDYSSVGLLNSYWSMIIPLAGFGLPMSVFLFGSFYSFIPKETYEAAVTRGLI